MSLETIILKLLLAASLGALMGLERDGNLKDKSDSKEIKKQAKSAYKKFSFIANDIPAKGIGGVRTYILVAVLGGVSGLAHYYGLTILASIVGASLFLFIIVAFILNYFDKNTLGLTTEVSILINYLAAFLLLGSDIPSKIIVAIVVFSTAIVTMKSEMHNIISKFSNREIIEIVKFILFALVILPFLPNKTFDLSQFPLIGDFIAELLNKDLISATQIFNPFRLWLVVIFIMTINFFGYFATKIFGGERSLAIIGMLGGFVSSTAVTETAALKSRELSRPIEQRALLISVLLANMSSFLRIILVASALNFTLAYSVAPSLLSMALFLGLYGFYLYSKSVSGSKDVESTQNIKILHFDSPFSIKAGLIFASLFIFITLFSSLAIYWLGESGFFIYSVIASMSGIDAVILSTATWLNSGSITISLAKSVLFAATIVNLVAKVLFAILTGDKKFGLQLFKVFFITIMIGTITFAVQIE